MDRLTLTYCEDQTTGLPRLEVVEGSLEPNALDALEGHCRRNYQQLIRCQEGETFSLDGPDRPGLPRHYTVRVRWINGNRVPTVELQAVDAGAGPDDSSLAAGKTKKLSRAAWQPEFLLELASVLVHRTSPAGQRSALDFVLGDLREVLRKNPRALTLLLLAGYLHAGDAICRRHGAPGHNKYTEAAGELNDLAGDLLPDGALDGLLAGGADG